MMPSLFQITDDVIALETLIDRLEADEELEDEDVVGALSAHLADSEEDLRDKVDGYVSYIRHLEAREKARREEAKHITLLARNDAAAIGRMKDAAKRAARKLGRSKLEGDTRSITVSTSKRPAVSWEDPATLPPQFTEATAVLNWTVDRKALTNYIMETGDLAYGVTIRAVTSVRFR